MKHLYQYTDRFYFDKPSQVFWKLWQAVWRVMPGPPARLTTLSDLGICTIYKTTQQLCCCIVFKHHLNPSTVCIISLKEIISEIMLHSSSYLQYLLWFGDPIICWFVGSRLHFNGQFWEAGCVNINLDKLILTSPGLIFLIWTMKILCFCKISQNTSQSWQQLCSWRYQGWGLRHRDAKLLAWAAASS